MCNSPRFPNYFSWLSLVNQVICLSFRWIVFFLSKIINVSRNEQLSRNRNNPINTFGKVKVYAYINNNFKVHRVYNYIVLLNNIFVLPLQPCRIPQRLYTFPYSLAMNIKPNLLNEINIYFLNTYAEHTGSLSYDLVYRTRGDRVMSAAKRNRPVEMLAIWGKRVWFFERKFLDSRYTYIFFMMSVSRNNGVGTIRLVDEIHSYFVSVSSKNRVNMGQVWFWFRVCGKEQYFWYINTINVKKYKFNIHTDTLGYLNLIAKLKICYNI